MAHIVIDARIINSSTGRYVERLLTYLEQIDTKNTYSILVPEKDKEYWKPINQNFTIRTVPYKNYSFGEQLGFSRYLTRLHADLVHFCMPQQPLLYRGKTVTTFHDLTLLKTYNSDKKWLAYHAKQRIGRHVFKRVAQKSTAIIAVSQYTKKELLSYFPVSEKKVHVIYESSDVSQVHPKKVSLPFSRYLLYVGQQSDYKNIQRLGDAHQFLRAKYPSLGLVLVGSKNSAARANEVYFADKKYANIHYTGFVSDAELSWLYAHADAYVFPSLMEGFGLPGLEAMGYGTPVISSNATCLPEIYNDAARYFNPLDTSDMAQAIDDVLSNDAVRAKLIRAGYSRIKKFSWKKQAQETLRVYEDIL